MVAELYLVRLKSEDVSLDLDPEAQEYLAEKGFDGRYGVQPLCSSKAGFRIR